MCVYMNLLSEESGYYVFPDSFYDEKISQLEIEVERDYRWYAVRHADAYMDIHVCGRQAIMKMERYGVSEEELDSTIDYYFKKHQLPKRSENARWWGLYLSPTIENENRQKVWIRFPDIEKPIWFYVDYFDREDGLVLSPNPRMISTRNLLKKYNNEFQKLVLAYPNTIEYALDKASKYFEEIEEYKPARSNVDKRIGFLVYPPPKVKRGYETSPYTGVGPVGWDKY